MPGHDCSSIVRTLGGFSLTFTVSWCSRHTAAPPQFNISNFFTAKDFSLNAKSASTHLFSHFCFLLNVWLFCTLFYSFTSQNIDLIMTRALDFFFQKHLSTFNTSFCDRCTSFVNYFRTRKGLSTSEIFFCNSTSKLQQTLFHHVLTTKFNIELNRFDLLHQKLYFHLLVLMLESKKTFQQQHRD